MSKMNPVFSGIKVDEIEELTIENTATRKGVAIKSILLFAITIVSGIISPIVFSSMPELIMICIIGALITGLVGQFSVKASPVCGILYAIFEGGMLGLLSYLFEYEIPGIVLTAVVMTISVFSVMLLLFTTNIIKANNKFLRFMSVFGMGLIIFFIVYFVTSLVAPEYINSLQENMPILLLVAGVILIYGALMLVIDFNNIENLVQHKFNKRYEWTAALSLMITIIWIYVELVRILAIINKFRR